MRFGCRGSRLAAVSSALTAALSLTASSATASDTFVLDNDSKTASLLGTSLWGKGNTMDAGCRTGPFPGPTETAFTFEPETAARSPSAGIRSQTACPASTL